jgi:hypothetical protein
MPTLTVLGVLILGLGIFYIASMVLYAKKIPWYMKNMKKLSPLLSKEPEAVKKNLFLMGLTAAIAIASGIGLWMGALWGILIVLAALVNETYRGAVVYVRDGNYKEAVKHMILMPFLMGYLISWVIFVYFQGILQKWIFGIIF